MIGILRVDEVFSFEKVTVARCSVVGGQVVMGNRIELYRQSYSRSLIMAMSGYLNSLKVEKENVGSVSRYGLCNLSIQDFNDINVGDIIVCLKGTGD